MTNTGCDHHDSLVEEAASWAAEGDRAGVGMMRPATLAVRAEATISWTVKLRAEAALIEQACGNVGPVALLACPWPLMQKKTHSIISVCFLLQHGCNYKNEITTIKNKGDGFFFGEIQYSKNILQYHIFQ